MKKLITAISKQALTVLSLTIIAFAAHAQKLPKIQTASVYAPDNIKIDGTPAEWNGKFQADNDPDRVKYTISNDDKNLYIIVRARAIFAGEKLMRGGLTLTIRPMTVKTSNKKAPDDVAITYPLQTNKQDLDKIVNSSKYFQVLKNDTAANKQKIDSLQKALTKMAFTAFNEIKVEGVKEINEPVMSVYNENGIRCAEGFGHRMEFTFEMAIPLKYLAADINSDGKFRYNIKLGETPELDPFGGVVNRAIAPPVMMINGAPAAERAPDSDNEFMYGVVDFWAEYTLAKK